MKLLYFLNVFLSWSQEAKYDNKDRNLTQTMCLSKKIVTTKFETHFWTISLAPTIFLKNLVVQELVFSYSRMHYPIAANSHL